VSVPLNQLVLENPFDLLDLSLDASERDIQHRLDELELEARLSLSGASDTSYLRQRVRLLENPAHRIEFEFFAPWGDVDHFRSVSAAHDQALRQTVAALGAAGDDVADASLGALEQWVAIASEQAIARAIIDRGRELGIELRSDWVSQQVARQIVPALIDILFRASNLDIDLQADRSDSKAYKAARLLVRVGQPHNSHGAVAVVRHLEALVDPSRLSVMTAGQVVSLMAFVDGIAALLQDSSKPSVRHLMRVVYQNYRSDAFQRFESGQVEDAERILSALANTSLSEPDRLEVTESLRALRFNRLMAHALELAQADRWSETQSVLATAKAIASPDHVSEVNRYLAIATYNSSWQRAVEHLEAGRLDEAITALGDAYRSAATDHQRSEIQQVISSVRHRKLTPPPRAMPPTNPRRTAVIVGAALALCLLAYGGSAIVAFVASLVSEPTVAAQFLDEFGSRATCSNLAGRPLVTQAQRFGPSSQIAAIILPEAGGSGSTLGVHDWDSELPASWRADAVSEISVVICIEDEAQRVEVCEYTPSGRVYRWRRATVVWVIEASTGQVLENRRWTGANPKQCPNTIFSEREDLYGDVPNLDSSGLMRFVSALAGR